MSSKLRVDKITNASQVIVEIADVDVLTLTAARAERLQDVSEVAATDGNFMVGDGSSWVAESGATARTSLGLGSIATQASNNVTITGGSITGITDLAVADGGTGSSTASGARSNLGFDGASGAIVLGDLAAALQAFLVPTGMVGPYAGASEPTGWLFCYGQAVSRTTYASLFTAISTTYGAGDGSTTFNLPDLRGRVVAGHDNMGGVSGNRLTGVGGSLNGDTLGATGGTETHTLITAEMPSHTHALANGGQIQSTGGGPAYGSAAVGLSATDIANTGGGGAHNNVQPTIILNYIIKT
jgi:microcystin-dependent protein